MKTISAIVFIFFAGFLSRQVNAQTDNLKVNLLIGYTRNYQLKAVSEKTYVLNPEIQLEGQLIKPILSWVIYFSYFNENISKPSDKIVDLNVFYSNKDLSIGTRIYYNTDEFLKNFPLVHLSFFVGYSHSFIFGENKLEINNDFPHFRNQELNIIEGGSKLVYDLTKKIGAVAEYTLKYHLGPRDRFPIHARSSVKLGISYFF